jgi:hypothetical protein
LTRDRSRNRPRRVTSQRRRRVPSENVTRPRCGTTSAVPNRRNRGAVQLRLHSQALLQRQAGSSRSLCCVAPARAATARPRPSTAKLKWRLAAKCALASIPGCEPITRLAIHRRRAHGGARTGHRHGAASNAATNLKQCLAAELPALIAFYRASQPVRTGSELCCRTQTDPTFSCHYFERRQRGTADLIRGAHE